MMRNLPVLVIAVLAATTTPAATLTQTVAFEAECLDLDTGALVRCLELPGEGSGDAVWDVVVGFHADREIHGVLAPNSAAAVETAHLRDRAFDDVTEADVAGAQFSRELLDEPFDAGRTILVRTDRGAVYKLGRAAEDDQGVTFDYELLVPAA